jgi:hypothetical protein
MPRSYYCWTIFSDPVTSRVTIVSDEAEKKSLCLAGWRFVANGPALMRNDPD